MNIRYNNHQKNIGRFFLKYFRLNVITFAVTYLFLCILVFLTSYKFLLNDFAKIEKEQNENSVVTFLNTINKNIETLKNTTNDYSNWDETYTFIQDKNKEYIYKNFREGSQTLQEINLDMIVYATSKNEIIYSQYINDFLKSNKDDLEKYLIDKYKNNQTLNTVVYFKSHLLYLFKSQVKRSDKTGDKVGYIFTAKLVDNKTLVEKYAIFNNIFISDNPSKYFELNIKLEFLQAKVSISKDAKVLKNNIQFFDETGKYLISCVTTSSRDLIINGEKTVLLFNLILYVVLFFVFFFIYRNQQLIHTQNIILNEQVEERTKKLNEAYIELDVKNKELSHLVNTDSLTRINNRRSYFEQSKQLLEKAIVNRQNLDVVIMDIDDFKKINDRYGHAIGDQVLVKFCEIVNSFLDKNIVFGRIGGEEFCLTFYNKEAEDVNAVCEAIRKRVEQTIISLDDKKIYFTISIGLSSKGDLDSIDKILHNADMFLYEAKKSGKNRIIRNS